MNQYIAIAADNKVKDVWASNATNAESMLNHWARSHGGVVSLNRVEKTMVVGNDPSSPYPHTTLRPV